MDDGGDSVYRLAPQLYGRRARRDGRSQLGAARFFRHFRFGYGGVLYRPHLGTTETGADDKSRENLGRLYRRDLRGDNHGLALYAALSGTSAYFLVGGDYSRLTGQHFRAV